MANGIIAATISSPPRITSGSEKVARIGRTRNGAAVASARDPAMPRTLSPARPLASHHARRTSRITPKAKTGIVMRTPSRPSS